MLKTCDLYDLSKSLLGDWLGTFEYPWLSLKQIKEKLFGKDRQAKYYRGVCRIAYRSGSVGELVAF